MPRLIFACLLLAAAATSADAQPFGRRGPRPEGPPHAPLFISPAGEPFRGGDGLAAWFAGADADHDGALNLAEVRADFLRFFKTLDADGDGRIDGFELQRYEREVAPEITRLGFDDGPGLGGGRPRMGGGPPGGGPPGGGPPGGGPGGGPPGGRGGGGFSHVRPPGGGGRGPGREGAGRYSLLNIPQPVANADEDIDGRITLVEWTRAATRRFAMLDKDKSGRLTTDRLRPPPPDKRAR